MNTRIVAYMLIVFFYFGCVLAPPLFFEDFDAGISVRGHHLQNSIPVFVSRLKTAPEINRFNIRQDGDSSKVCPSST